MLVKIFGKTRVNIYIYTPFSDDHDIIMALVKNYPEF